MVVELALMLWEQDVLVLEQKETELLLGMILTLGKVVLVKLVQVQQVE